MSEHIIRSEKEPVALFEPVAQASIRSTATGLKRRRSRYLLRQVLVAWLCHLVATRHLWCASLTRKYCFSPRDAGTTASTRHRARKPVHG
jgi:hypothetical protein